jgi:hypothetical protein
MFIWLNLLIPMLAIVILVVFFRKNVAWWEYLLVFGAPLIVIVICKFTSVMSQVNTSECWNSFGTSAVYFEYWETWDHETCYRTVSCGKDCTTQEPYDCSHCDHNSEYWELYDNIGNAFRIDKATFDRLCQLWGNKVFEDENRSIDHHWGCGQDGDAYRTKFDGQFEHTVPAVTKHIYENKVKCAKKSVFNFQEVRKDEIKQYSLFDYPTIDCFNYNPILGWNDKNASDRLQKYNGQFGSFKKVHMLILVFKDQPYEASLMQEAYWKGGNKNEFILCIGLKGNEITWTKVISWTDKEEVKVTVARKVKELQQLDMNKIVEIMAAEVKLKFVKKNFRDFDYLTIEPTSTAILITFILSLLLSVGLSIYVIKNEFDLDD